MLHDLPVHLSQVQGPIGDIMKFRDHLLDQRPCFQDAAQYAHGKRSKMRILSAPPGIPRSVALYSRHSTCIYVQHRLLLHIWKHLACRLVPCLPHLFAILLRGAFRAGAPKITVTTQRPGWFVFGASPGPVEETEG